MQTNLWWQKTDHCSPGDREMEGWMTNRHKDTLGSNWYVYWLDCGYGFIVYTYVKTHCNSLDPIRWEKPHHRLSRGSLILRLINY